MDQESDQHQTAPTRVVPVERDQDGEAHRITLVQLPRRVFLLLLSFVGALLLIWVTTFVAGGDPGSLQSQLSLDELTRATNTTLSLLLVTFLFAFPLALLLVGFAAFERRIQVEFGRAGLLLRIGSRLLVFALLTTPVLLLTLVVRWLEIAEIHGVLRAPFSFSALASARLPVAALILALLPALLAAQAASRRLALSTSSASPVVVSLLVIAKLLRQTGGLLSAATVVEIVFDRPGLGNLLLLSFFHESPGALPVILSLLALLLLTGLLLAELSQWGAQLLTAAGKPAPGKAHRPRERRLWIGVAVLLILVPLALAAGGLLTEPDRALRQNFQGQNQPPSPTHPLGTDELGRDVWARALRGGLSTVRRSSGVAALSLIPGFFLGILAGVVARPGRWLRETVADLLLLPLDVLLFIPLIPGAVAVLLLWRESGGPLLVVALALLLLPRVAHATRIVWDAKATDRKSGRDLLVGLSALFLGTLFIAFGTMTALEFVGLGPQPPLPSLGLLLQNTQGAVVTNPQQVTSLAVIVAVHSLTFYTAADSLLDAFNTKGAMAALNQ